MGHLHLRKVINEETTWVDKSKDKHKCNYVVHCILKVKTKQNITKYYDVKKCDKCLSFKSISKRHNVSGCIFEDLTPVQKKLPVIEALGNNYYTIGFQELKNVTYKGEIKNDD